MDILRGGFMPGLLGNGGGAAAGAFPASSLDLDFTAGTSVGAQLTTVRASTGYADSTAGVWTSFATNAPRITDKGLLVEEARTNSIRNNSMTGAAAGTPGTPPTNWAPAASGLTIQLVAVGTEKGIEYADYRFSGTTSSTFGQVLFDGFTNIAAVNGQTWTFSIFLKLVSGSLANVTGMSTSCSQRDAGGVGLTSLIADALIHTTLSANLTRFLGTFTTNHASTAFLLPLLGFGWNAGVAVDFTLRIGWPQLELGAFVTSPIRTTTVAATRAADIITTASFGWFNPTEGTIFVEAGALVGIADRALATLHDGTGNERISIATGASNTVINPFVIDGGVSQAALTGSAITNPLKVAMAYKLNDFAQSQNGATVVADVSGTLPTVDRMHVGASATPAVVGTNLIRRVAYWNTRLTNDQLRQITTNAPAWVLNYTPSLDIDLANNRGWAVGSSEGTAAALLTTTRASAGYADNAAGAWTEFATNAPRITDKGLLVEEARTNSIRNNSMQGAVAGVVGSGGAPPTNWGVVGATSLTQTVVGTGTSLGIDYIDIRLSGTSGGTFSNIAFDTTTGIAALTAQGWTASAFVALIGGSLANIGTINLITHETTAVGAFVVQNTGADFDTELNTSLARKTYSFTTAGGGTTAFLRPFVAVNHSSGVPIDFTLRIGWPQLELGAFVTSPIRTTTVAVTRAADAITLGAGVTGLSTEYTLFGEALSLDGVQTSGSPALAQLDNGTLNERSLIARTITPQPGANVIVGGAAVAGFGVGTWGNATVKKLALAVKVNDFAFSYDGVTPLTDTLGAMPANPTTLRIGSNTAAFFGGYIRRVAYWSSRLSNAALQSLTT